MQQIIDPRQRGFSYGPGWGEEQKPLVFHQATELARKLARIAREASDRAWSLEMALKTVRIATYQHEKDEAIAKLEIEVAKHSFIN